MCGIIGGNYKDWNYQAAVDALKHRGPDAQGVKSLAEMTLAFCRLSIIDLSEKAMQPMMSSDQQIAIVFNGELYGYKKLRDELLAKKHIFQSESDTEVLLNAYVEWGEEFIQHVDGMFAIAIYDQRERKLKLFRDRAGIKPCYYYFDQGRFAFASELKGITALCSDTKFEIDYTAIYDYLTYLYIPYPKSMYKNVFQLPPAHKLIFDIHEKQVISCLPYWQLNTQTYPVDISSAAAKIKALIHHSVEKQMIADVPVGFFLSGGMDSSTIVAEASSISQKIETFSIGFDDASHVETEYARIVAEKYQTRHHEKILSNDETENLFPRLKIWYDEPFADTSAFPTYLVSRYSRENVIVALTGDGGDEVFGGYNWYTRFKKIQSIPFLQLKLLNSLLVRLRNLFSYKSKPFDLLHKLNLITADPLECYCQLMGGMTTRDKEEYRLKWGIDEDYDSYWHFRKFYRTDLPVLTRLQYLDFHTYLPGDILTKVDRVTMDVSLEARVPLLDKDIIEYAFSLPEEVRYYGNTLKGCLKQAYKNSLPNEIINRGKKGFSIPKRYFHQTKVRKQERILKELFQENI